VIAVTPLGVEKTHPPTETTLPTDNPEMESVVKFVKVVAAVVCSVIITGARIGGVPTAAVGGTKKIGMVLRVKLNPPVLMAATEPVIWLGSRIILFVVKVTAGPAKAVELADPVAGVTDPWMATETS
jgi:hypothetical protein